MVTLRALLIWERGTEFNWAELTKYRSAKPCSPGNSNCNISVCSLSCYFHTYTALPEPKVKA